ncbi:hypothetical protein [Pseudomonas syringae]|uniref:EF-hand domain-containing protein n=1 Tax=Pseudomonas amygdali pv. mori str. 301020 TaxID=629261 RepID=A0A656G9C3_PSEA0|nr:hypothetical protein PSYMO_11580 [Pseudomonas amygdali pv. mori str. 301020]PYD17893.1 hypothetical protein DND62_00415 [Pseudomonas syringae pv. pisi]
MDKRPTFWSPWDWALVEAAELKFDHLYAFDNDCSGVISQADVHGTFDALCINTDMQHDDDFLFFENGSAALPWPMTWEESSGRCADDKLIADQNRVSIDQSLGGRSSGKSNTLPYGS